MSQTVLDYYVGLDLGTSSVGWAVSDDHYHLLTVRDKTMWGARLFDEAEPASGRRLCRATRRRLRRTRDRIKLLQLLFEPEIAPVDPEFYLRMERSFLVEADKDLANNSSNTLFNDPDFKDKDYHKAYPTIWHLRNKLITAKAEEHFDIRLYYLAIGHILAHRGHFLIEGSMEAVNDFAGLYQTFIELAANCGFEVDADAQERVQAILTDRQKRISDKKKELPAILFVSSDDDGFEEKEKQQKALGQLLAGSKINLNTVFGNNTEEKLSLSLSDNLEDKMPEIETTFNSEQVELLLATKRLYDFGVLQQLLGDHRSISEAMVDNYNQHQKQLSELKRLLKPFPEDYYQLFRQLEAKKGTVSYNAYIGKAYEKNKDGRKSHYLVSQEDINKMIVELLEKHQLETPLLALAKNNQLLPKQRGQAKGTIPMQLHQQELKLILERLGRDYPSFAQKVEGEDETCNTKLKKISLLHSFRIPYYCGPLVTKEKSQFSWGSKEIKELVRPWNFEKIMNDLHELDKRASAFIKRMTNRCTYLPTEDVLPKASLLYQKYCVLNELNNLKFDGKRLENDVALKQKIFQRGFIDGKLTGNITLKSLSKYLHDSGLIESDVKVSGTSETKFLPRLSTHQDFCKIFGDDYEENFTSEQLEKVIELITILGDEKKMLEKKITETLGADKCTPEQAKKLARKNYKDWARFSATFLTKITANVSHQEMNILQALYETNYNLEELRGQQFGFTQSIAAYNHSDEQSTRVTYKDITKLYCSAPVRRMIWQALRILDEIVRVQGAAPKKIFLEATRGGETKPTPKYTASRKNKLLECYKNLQNSETNQELLNSLNNCEPRELQSKRLYLYYTQLGRCAYCGEHIDLEHLSDRAYDIDHIYPQSKTKDDSLLNNNVLVCAKCNRKKTDRYPLSEVDPTWQPGMHSRWELWRHAGLINKEKYDRLTRTTPLTEDELSKFIARQLVETSQSVRALRDLLVRRYPDTKIVLVKAGQVSDFRQHFAQGNHSEVHPEYNAPARPEFIKVRALNDLHHAQDAYLNIVVGNVMSQTFTDNPYTWLKERQGKRYSLKPEVIFKENSNDGKPDFPRAWYYQETIQTVSEVLQKPETILWTRQTDRVTGQISDLQIVGKNDNPDVLPIKRGLDPQKYGGYNSIKGSYFALIEVSEKKGLRRKIVQIPIMNTSSPQEYLQSKYPGCSVLKERIEKWSLFLVDGNFMRIAGRTGNSLIFAPAKQLVLDVSTSVYLKKVNNVYLKLLQNKNYKVDETKDSINSEANIMLYDTLTGEIKRHFSTASTLGINVQKFDEKSRTRFAKLSIEDQCKIINDIILAFGCNTSSANLNSILTKAIAVGKCLTSNDITDLNDVKLIQESPTGLFAKVIDLKAIEVKT